MTARLVDEPHRVSSHLELLVDLTFVVAISRVTTQLAREIADGRSLEGVTPYLQVFFAIWWAWMNFTWFASSYDTDDVRYRLLTLLQMAGVLVLGAGVPAALDDNDYRAVTLGYLIMRIGLIAQWLRAAVEDPDGRRTARRYAAAIALAEVGWLLRLLGAEVGWLPDRSLLPVFLGLVLVEVSVPWWAERYRSTSWHPHHIAERYGLFTIILLGEGVFAASTGVEGAIDGGNLDASFVAIAVGGLALLFALWWLYFLEPCGPGLSARRERSYVWGYGHYGIFAALAALGAGLEVAVEHAGHHARTSPQQVGYAIAIPVSTFLSLLWAVRSPVVSRRVIRPTVILPAVAGVLLVPLGAGATGLAVVVTTIAAICAAVVAVTLLRSTRADDDGQQPATSAARCAERSARCAVTHGHEPSGRTV